MKEGISFVEKDVISRSKIHSYIAVTKPMFSKRKQSSLF